MKITLVGLNRRVHRHCLMLDDIAEVEPHDQTRYPKLLKSNGDVTVVNTRKDVILNGDFTVEVSFSKQEIAHLAKIALSDDPFAEAIAMISNRQRETRKRTRKN